MAPKTSRGSDQFMVRLPDGMRKRIERAAKTSGRSMNAEIVAALIEHFPDDATVDELIDHTNALARVAAKLDPPHHGLGSLVHALRDISIRVAGEDGRTDPESLAKAFVKAIEYDDENDE